MPSLTGIRKFLPDITMEMMYMTIVPMYKICPRCKRRYEWNPDIGRMWCPYCGPGSTLGAGDIPWVRKIFNRKKK